MARPIGKVTIAGHNPSHNESPVNARKGPDTIRPAAIEYVNT